MAQAKAEVVDVESPPKSKKMLYILLIAILLLAMGGGAAYYFLIHKDSKNETAEPVKEVKQKALIYMPLENFVVNLLPEADGDQVFLQVGINLQVDESKDIDVIKANMPQVRSRLLLLLSSQSAKVLETPGGKNKLMADILTEIKRPFAKDHQEQKVANVFFTSFIIQ